MRSAYTTCSLVMRHERISTYPEPRLRLMGQLIAPDREQRRHHHNSPPCAYENSNSIIHCGRMAEKAQAPRSRLFFLSTPLRTPGFFSFSVSSGNGLGIFGTGGRFWNLPVSISMRPRSTTALCRAISSSVAPVCLATLELSAPRSASPAPCAGH